MQQTLNQNPELMPAVPPAMELRVFMHKVSAGFPSPATDYIEEGLDLNSYLVRNPLATFMFTVAGLSMRDVGILNGDKLVVDRSRNAKHGDIVVAVLEGEYTVKQLHRRGGRVALLAANPEFKPIIMGDDRVLEVWGVVTGSLRRYG